MTEPEELHRLARQVEGQGDFRTAIELYEQAYAALRARGETRLPALIAGRWISFLYAAVHGNQAACNGWLERARRLCAQAGDCPELGWVRLAEALMTDDAAVKARHAAEAQEIAERFGDTDLGFLAMAYAGTALVMDGRVPDGMRLIDEAATAATNGEVADHVTSGEIYCKVLLCCELALDVRRAGQWMEVAEAFARRTGYLPVSAICRMYYGGILIAAGRWVEAEEQLTRSAALYADGYAAMRSGAVVRLADLRVRQGRLEEAELLLEGLEHDSYAVRPLAALHLARGRPELAATVLRRSPGPLPEPCTALLVEAELAMGARAVAPTGVLSPHLSYAAGLVTGELAHFERALAAAVSAGLPLEEGRIRLAIARTLAVREPKVAAAEACRALETFTTLGAALHRSEAAALLRELGLTPLTGRRGGGRLTEREKEVLALVAEGLPNDEIARRLFISKRTAEHHVGNILAKLGLTTRAEAVAHALREGLGW
ncbi:MAG: tetratricopeptide repeat protein [Thermoactinospora sp.]|nr:tetratricopeptide repeat protein [Thermoactinospora sp.]